MDIEQTDHLNAYFSDIAPPAQAAGPVAPATPVAAGPAPTPQVGRDPAAPTVAAKEPEKPVKPPMKIRSQRIETWVTRYPMPKQPIAVGAIANPNEPADGGLKYQLKNAHCDGMVSVHQDPEDNKKPRGTDILGSRMLIDSTTGRQHSHCVRMGQQTRRSPQRGHVPHRPEDRDRPVAQLRDRSRAAVRSP